MSTRNIIFDDFPYNYYIFLLIIESKKIALVVGSVGFTRSHIVTLLKNEGYYVVSSHIKNRE